MAQHSVAPGLGVVGGDYVAHVYGDFRSSLAERGHSPLPDSSRWRDRIDV